MTLTVKRQIGFIIFLMLLLIGNKIFHFGGPDLNKGLIVFSGWILLAILIPHFIRKKVSKGNTK